MDIIKFLETAEASIFLKINPLMKRNVTIQGKRTSLTLEPLIWDILNEVASEKDCSVHDLCTMIKERKDDGISMSSAIRVFLTGYLFIKYKKAQSKE